MVASLPVPEGLSLDAATWNQTPLVVQQLVLHLLTVTRQQDERIKTLEARLAALEARGQQNSRHSDRPPSSDPPWVQPPPPGGPKGTPGARPGPPGHRQALWEPTEVIEVKPPACVCGQRACLDLSPFSTHQVIELPELNMIGRHVVLYEACCPQCGRVTKAHVPPEACAGYGPRLTALIGELSGSQRSSRSAVQEFCQSVLGVAISQGAIQRAVDRVSEALIPYYEAIAEQARQARVNYIDETGWYQHGMLAWLWVMVNPTVALFKVQASRSQAAFGALVASWAGILVSDGYLVYQQWIHGRQTCLAPLIRRARGLAERKEPERATDGRGRAGLVCAAGASAEPVPAPERRGGDVRPHAGAGIGCSVDICRGRRRRAHQQPRRKGPAVCGALAQADAGYLQREGRSLGGADPLGAGDVSLVGAPHLPGAGRGSHVRVQRPASRCLLDLMDPTP